MRFIPVTIHIQEGDVITSKKGFLQKSAISERNYLVKKQKFIGEEKVSGNALWEVIGDKIEVENIREVTDEKVQ